MTMAVAISVGDLRAFCMGAMPHASDFDRMMINEAAFGLSRLQPLLDDAVPAGRTPRLLEVGAGPLMLSSYLAARGYGVTAVEPSGDGFESFTPLQDAMLEAARRGDAAPVLVRSAIETAALPAAFDIVFSVNALEHMADPWKAIDVMYAALRPGGTLLVHCPNYEVPFDSHFGIVLVTRRKQVNERIYSRRVATRPECWRGLRFIRLSDVRRHCATRGYRVTFNRAMLGDAIRRLQRDPVFATRMPWFVRGIGRLLGTAPVAAALASVPVRWQTPMEFAIFKPAGAL